MKAIIRFATILLLGSLLLSCQSFTPQVSKITPMVAMTSPSPFLSATPPASSTQTALPTRTPQPTFTPLPATSTITSDMLPLQAFEQHCVTVENSLLPGFLTNGTIILEWEYEWLSYAMMILTAEDEQPHLSPDLPEGGGGGISPDGNWLAYSSWSGLTILTSDGRLQVSHPWNDKWGNIQGWLDSERLLFEHIDQSSATLYIYNPFTDQGEIFSTEIDDRYIYDRELSGWYAWKIVPDPTLTRLAYMRAHFKGNELTFPPTLVLVDLENGKTLWELKRFSPGDRLIPVWSPDGSQMAVISDDYQGVEYNNRWEVFTVDRDGQAIQWLDIKAETFVASSDWVEGLKWSPNGRYLAFFAESLYILDTESSQAFDLCIPYGQGDRFEQNVIIWSPDSTQILFQRSDAPTVVIDLESNRAAPLTDDINMRPIGWLRSD